jgi:hypothetical protein
MIRAAVKLALALALTLGGVAVVGAPTPAGAAPAAVGADADCSGTAARVAVLADRLADVRSRHARAVERTRELRRTVTRLERRVRAHRTPRKARLLAQARAELRTTQARVRTIGGIAGRTRDDLVAARIAHRLCTAPPEQAETELLDILDLLGLSPLLDMIGLPGLLQTLGVVELLDRLGLADVLENLGLGSLIGR